MENLLKQISRRLGVNEKYVSISPNYILLSKKQTINFHKNNKTNDKTFATLVVQLPSYYDGEITIKYQGILLKIHEKYAIFKKNTKNKN